MIIADAECTRCNGSGEVAMSIYYPCRYICAGPVPDYAKNVQASKCDRCDGTGVVEVDCDQSGDDA